MANNNALKTEFAELLLNGNSALAIEKTNQLFNEGMDPLEYFQTIFTPAMEIIGEKFGRLEIFLPELMQSAETAKELSAKAIQPHIEKTGKTEGTEKRGKVLLASVRGDLHDIGKSMVSLMLEVNGFEIVDIGVDVDTRTIIDRALDEEVHIVGLSSLMTTSMPYMKEIVEMREGLGYLDKFAIIVGGAPITEEYCNEIGADTFGKDAVDAVGKCKSLMEARKK